VPGVFSWLSRIVAELDYTLVMVTNQDGLGTASFPEDTFWPAHKKMMETLEGEGIFFEEVLIDKSFPADNLDTRKPGTGLLQHYLQGNYDLANSYVIGDRASDVQLAQNLGAKSVLLNSEPLIEATLRTTSWQEIYQHLKNLSGSASVERSTNETQIAVQLSLYGSGSAAIDTGIGFFDHMLEQVAHHSGSNISLSVKGDLHIDEHHSIEDAALALGQAYKSALGNRSGITRYGHSLLPMDEVLATVALDFSGRPWCVFNAHFQRERVGGLPAEMVEHFFKSFADAAGCTLHLSVTEGNAHHQIEALFKGFAKALKMALTKTGSSGIPSTKGVL
jgi:imidazoleglycerol-phosphate dehydratase/histidinol-phosphatase